MNRALLILLCALALVFPGTANLPIGPSIASAATDDSDSSTPDTSGTDNGITPNSGELSPGDILTLSFPEPMVPPDRIDMGNQPWPVTATPRVDGTFLWKSQTEAQLVIGSVVAGSSPHFALAPGLKDAAGHPMTGDAWTADFTTAKFSLSTDAEFRKHLPAQPEVPLSSTYDILLTDVARHAWIQDRDSRARYPVDAIQTSGSSLVAHEFEVTPTNPLPPNHTYDLVFEGLQDARSHQPLPYPNIFPLGDTHDLKIDWLGAFNSALEPPTVRIKFNDSIAPEALKSGMIQITPDVPNLKILPSDDEVDLTGDFDLTARYHVTVSTALVGDRGYALPAESRWAASFLPRQPCISFPGPRIYLRSSTLLHFAFVQSHTPAVTWKLASIPLEKLPAVSQRLDEFNQSALDPLTGLTIPDPKTGGDLQKQTELLVSAFNLPVLLTGSAPGIDTPTEETRTVTAPLPQGVALSGPYLIEASSTLPDGRIAGGRSLIFFSDTILTQKRSSSQVFLRVARMSDALPVSGITVRAVTDKNIELGRAVTDSTGLAIFPFGQLFPGNNQPQTNLFIADTPGGPSLAFADVSTYATPGDNAPPKVANHALLITDRNLYRPGEDVKIKGILRDETGSGLAIPATGDIHWQILQGDGDKVIGEGTTPRVDEGAFEASWHIPEKAALGQCTLKCSLDGKDYSGTSTIDIEEYRVPLFTAQVDAATAETGTAAHAQVSSVFFHGGPNSGARVHWKAEWTAIAETGSNTRRYNAFPAIGPTLDLYKDLSQTVEGDTRLNANGQATLACDSPFKTNAAVGISHLNWHADITSIDGQTLAGGASETFSSSLVVLGVDAEEQLTAPRGITASLEAIDPKGDPVSTPVNVTADLYRVTTKTVKEQVAPLVFRYHNDDQFAKVDSRDAPAPGSVLFTATTTGDYVVAVRGRDFQTPIVSDETTLTGDEPAEMPVENDTSFPLTTRKTPWLPGDKAIFTLQAPYAGVAWVSIETDHVLDTMLVPLSGNAARIEIPVKKEYAPNATVSVYLTRPGGPSALPVERFAIAPLVVRRPDRELLLAPHLDVTEARPGQSIHGEVLATSEGQPVPAADLAVFAVDDAVLQLGGWTLPDALSTFYPLNPYSITNYQSLTSFLDLGNATGGFQKGFVIGDGGEATPSITNLRKEFRTLAYWNASLKTGADGKATFDFQAPDNLTTYRIVAIGQTKSNQFGGNADVTVKITKPLLIDPAFPRFLRDGDEVELRAVVRQSFADSTPIFAKCIAPRSCDFNGHFIARFAFTGPSVVVGRLGGGSACIIIGSATRNAPFVLQFRAKITDPDLKPIKIRFEASTTNSAFSLQPLALNDAVEITIPVSPPTITRHETIAGPFISPLAGPCSDPAAVMPKDWTKARGTYALTLSTSSWLPAIAGIPTILDYPHGCFEQITSKLLCYALMANLMDYLPGTEARLADYNAIFQKGIEQIGASLLDDGRLPYWPGETTGNDFVTCQAAWALNEAANAGFEIPEGLAGKLSTGVKSIASTSEDADTRAFALFVLASLKSGEDESALADDIYLHRANMGFDGRALLAMAFHQLNIMPDEKLQLLREIDKAVVPTAFKPATFGSPNRAEGICAMAFESIAPPNFTPAKKDEIRKRLLNILDSASILSTQENLWLLLAFKSMLDAIPPVALPPLDPAPTLLSKNAASAAWTSGTANLPIGKPFPIAGLKKTVSYLIQSDFTLPDLSPPRVDRGFRVERVLHDLTAPARLGTPTAPFHIGDQLLITYRIFTEKQQYYVALEDSLPAAFETVNPNLAQIGKFFEIPAPDPNDQLLDLSHSEMRDRSTLLYFDDIPPGPGVYSILARVTAAGAFRWPQTQVTPMYDSRFSGLSAASLCVVSAE